MKNLKILLFFALLTLSAFFYLRRATAEETTEKAEETKENEKIIWKNPLPKMIEQLKHRAEETLDELNRNFDFPFHNFDDISSQALDVLIQEIDEEIDQICVQNNEEAAKAAAILVKKQRKIYRLMSILYEYEKYTFFYNQGEKYINTLKELGWIIHYHDFPLFLNILSRFNDSRYRFEIDKELNINFERIVIFSSEDIEFYNSLVTGIIKYDNQVKDKLREDMVGFYFRGHLNDPMAMIDSEVFELRWLDSEGQKHIVWHYIMPYPFPLPIFVFNSLY
jgi:hypothetical protein